MEPAQGARARRLPPKQINCKWWIKGHCFRGADCFFRHDEAFRGRDLASRTKAAGAGFAMERELPSSSTPAAAEPEKCGICLEIPVTYGLLVKCDHIFCLECIREWRTSHNGNDGTTSPFSEHPGQPNPKKTCPMCRKPSDFVVPSSVFPTPPEHAETAKAANNAEAGSDQNDSRPSKPKNHMKEKIIATYLEKLKKIPCRYFEEGIRRWRTRTASSSSAVPFRPMCFFGNRCHYAHTQPISGEPYVFSDQELVVIEEVRAEQRASSHGVPHPSLDPSMLENMVETFGVLFGMELPAMFGAEMGPPPLGAPAILRALQEESLRQMGYAIDSDEDGDEWEDYDTGEEDDSDDDDDLPELIPFEVDSDDGDDDLPELISFQVDGTSANTGNDGDAGFEDMPGLIPLEADVSDEDYGDMPGLIPLETDALDEDYGDMPGLIPRDVDSANDGNDDYSGGTPNLMDLISFSIGSDNDSDEPPDLIELDT